MVPVNSLYLQNQLRSFIALGLVFMYERKFNHRSWERSIGRHFSHVTKSRILKNLNLRKKADSNFPSNSLKNHFKSPKLIDQKSLLHGHLLKDKRLNFTFLRRPIFQVLVSGGSPPKKILIHENRYFLLI